MADLPANFAIFIVVGAAILALIIVVLIAVLNFFIKKRHLNLIYTKTKDDRIFEAVKEARDDFEGSSESK